MLFEFINIFATCQKIINDILREYLNDFVIIYLNNIFVYSFTLKQYVKYINKILKRLNERDLRFKSFFHQKK